MDTLVLDEVKDPETMVFINDLGTISISQPTEECMLCGHSETMIVVFSSERARLIAKHLMLLADEIDKGEEE